ncbi:hypothetical protein B0T16DRAFT_416845 [Cercophora newfieldiana]|uniref:Uncharacterized protein n=1 Tax=Cercophora newfieldiana TaxID=92897 RepID=A0AA40CMF1_9PEZI|nr:hypothetical protein B0T16DRAFT_416845 [Cercophora newfieldiana]
MASQQPQQPTSGVPPYPPLQQALAQNYDFPSGKPTADASYKPQPPPDAGYRPSGNPESYRPPVDPSYPPPPGVNGSTYQPPLGINDPKYGPAPPGASDSQYRPTQGANASYQPVPQTSGLTYNGPPPPASQAPSYPPPPMTVLEQMPGPSMTPLPLATAIKPTLKDTKVATEFSLREYMNLQRSRYRKEEVGIEERLRIQASTVLGDLRSLRQEVGDMVKSAEKHRWRRFIIGGALATFIPAVRTIFRRPRDERDSANDTEYAFRRSKSLISRILSSATRPGFATLAFFVFAVMYVFQNEVTLRIARTVAKRLKKLSSKVERGEEEINEEDMKLLKGWRWNILLWS